MSSAMRLTSLEYRRVGALTHHQLDRQMSLLDATYPLGVVFLAQNCVNLLEAFVILFGIQKPLFTVLGQFLLPSRKPRLSYAEEVIYSAHQVMRSNRCQGGQSFCCQAAVPLKAFLNNILLLFAIFFRLGD